MAEFFALDLRSRTLNPKFPKFWLLCSLRRLKMVEKENLSCLRKSDMMYDVIVIGAGPAGNTTAKKCAEYGFKTALLEKSELPRDKVCTGFVLGTVAQSLVKQEFGQLPKAVMAQPPN